MTNLEEAELKRLSKLFFTRETVKVGWVIVTN